MKVKNTRQGLHTPVDTWVREGQQFTLFGLIHMADAQYWQDISRLIEVREAAGDVVHYEQLQPRHDDSGRKFHPFDLPLLSELTSEQGANVRLATRLGMVEQGDGLTYPSHWQNHDLPMLDVHRMLRSKKPGAAAKPQPAGEPPELSRREVRAYRNLLLSLGWLDTVYLWLNPWKRLVSVDWRNLHAMSAVLDVPSDQSVTLLWGAAHLKGMGKILSRNGFTRVSREWVLAVHAKAPTPQVLPERRAAAGQP